MAFKEKGRPGEGSPILKDVRADNQDIASPAIAINDAGLKVVLAKWIERLALDPSINLYAFRVAQRLCSKVRNETYRADIQKCRSRADSAVLALLVERGHVVQIEEAFPGKSAFRLVLEATL